MSQEIQPNIWQAAAGLTPLARGEYHLTFLEDDGLTRRLTRELKSVAHDAELTWPEFKRDPVGFTKRSATAYGKATWKFASARDNAVAMIAAVVLIAGVVGAVVALERLRMSRGASANPYENLEIVGYVDPENPIPKEQPTPEKGAAGTNEGKGGGSKPKYEKPAGGGGGGRQEQAPASAGKLPTAQLEVDRKSTRLNSSHANISYAVFCLKKKTNPTARCVHPAR